jgi:hypothetical protein
MQDWTDNRYECIQYMLSTSDHTWDQLNRMPDSLLSDMVRYDLQLD